MTAHDLEPQGLTGVTMAGPSQFSHRGEPENAVLRRQIGRVRYQPGDRLWLAALSG
jgi:hypothetical protein